MKATIELPDDLVREAEASGALAGKELKDVLAEGLRLLLAQTAPAPRPEAGEGDHARSRADVGGHDITAWGRLRAAWQSPFPGLTAMEMLDEFRGPVELPPPR